LAIALFGVNPLGPLLLLCRVLGGGTGLSIDAFARSPTHPMLREMYLDAGVRWGCGYFFFLQPSSRCIAFLAAMAAAGLVLTGLTRSSRWRRVGVGGCVALACAMNPIVGTGAAFSLLVALVIVGRPWQNRLSPRLAAWRGLSISLIAGSVIALPTYHQLLDGRSVGLPLEHSLVGLAAKAVEIGLFGLLPIVLTVWGWRSGRLRRPQVQVLAVAGCVLLIVCWVTHVPAGREHSFFNLGIFFLAIPAASSCGRPPDAVSVPGVRRGRIGSWVVAAGIAPVAIVTLVSFIYRQPVDLQRDGVFLRDGRDPDRLAIYAWIADRTPRETLIITDVRDGRHTAFYAPESEVPAMTRRKLLVDVPGMYMPDDPAVAQRRAMVSTLFAGGRLTMSQRDGLASLGRPILALSCAPDDERGLSASGFAMVFRSGTHAAYAWPANGLARGPRLADRPAIDFEEGSWPSSR
jgi:hypothetical protein